MMNFDIKRQESNSRGHLILRALFGPIYIGIPYIVVWGIFSIALYFINLINFFRLLFTGKYSESAWSWNERMIRWQLRYSAVMGNLVDGYPAIGLNGSHPNVHFSVPYREDFPNWRVVIRGLWGASMLAPFVFISLVLAIAQSFVSFIAFWAILFTGQFPEGMFNFVVKVMRFTLRFNVWMTFLTEGYPQLNLQVGEKIVTDAENKNIKW